MSGKHSFTRQNHRIIRFCPWVVFSGPGQNTRILGFCTRVVFVWVWTKSLNSMILSTRIPDFSPREFLWAGPGPNWARGPGPSPRFALGPDRARENQTTVDKILEFYCFVQARNKQPTDTILEFYLSTEIVFVGNLVGTAGTNK